MKKLLSFCLFALFLFACRETSRDAGAVETPNKNGLQLVTASNPEWQYQNLRLYPVTADAASINTNAGHLKTLAEAMKTPGFRVLERKQFGRSDDVWYHGLTIQNKTQDTVLILSGDVVTGGNQDRVMAYHDLVLPGTVKNVEVYCVEAGRSHYYDENASPAEKSVGAFKGYYNVASPKVRHAVQSSRNQGEVWDAVAKVTEANGASSSTKAYAALDAAGDQKAKRDAYLKFFEGKLDRETNIVGVVAVCGDKVLGVDVFSNPDLFKRQFPGLLHGYVAEAAVEQSNNQLPENDVAATFRSIARLAAPDSKSTDDAGRFSVGDSWVHLFKK